MSSYNPEVQAWGQEKRTKVDAWHEGLEDKRHTAENLEGLIRGPYEGEVNIVAEAPQFFMELVASNALWQVRPSMKESFMPPIVTGGRVFEHDRVLECRVPLQDGKVCLLYMLAGDSSSLRYLDYRGCAFVLGRPLPSNPGAEGSAALLPVGYVGGNHGLTFHEIEDFILMAAAYNSFVYLQGALDPRDEKPAVENTPDLPTQV